MQQLLQDLKHALRMLRDHPGFTATIVAALTLGIGVNTAVFSVVNTVLLNPLPFPDADTLVAVENTSHGKAYGPWTSPTKYMYWRAQTNVFSDVTAIDAYPRFLNYTGGDKPELVTATRVSESYFRVLGAPLARGRPFTAQEDRPGGPKVAVISYAFWQQNFGGAKDILGKRLPLSGRSYTIVGILSRGFDADPYFDAQSSGDKPDLLVPFQLNPSTTNQGNSFVNIARLRPGVTLAEAQSRVEASAAPYRQRFPITMPKSEGFTVLTAQQAMTNLFGNPHGRLWVLLGAVGFVLLIACANVANLLLMRATGRAHEIAIRSALGAGRSRIVRQLLTESLLLSAIGGLLGLGVGFFGIRALLAVNTAGLPRLGAGGALVGMDWHVVAFTLGLSLATGLIFGLAPAFAGSRPDLHAVIKASGSRSGNAFRHNRTRSALVTVEVGLAVVLLIGAGLLIRTSLALGGMDPGFDPSHVVTMHTALSGARFRTSASMASTVRAGLERVRSLPGVKSAALTSYLPPHATVSMPFAILGRPPEPSGRYVHYVPSSDGNFAALGIRVIRGRAFTAHDDAGALPVAVINETMAKRFWENGQNPLQSRIMIGGSGLSRGATRRIVGIVGDAHYGGLDRQPGPTVYVPLAQLNKSEYASFASFGAPTAWVVRTRGDSATLTASIRNAFRDATGLPVVDVEPMARVLSNSVSRQRLNMLLMSTFGGAALLLAAIGIYGLLAYSVQQRVREIGIRLALGAVPERVKGMVVRQGMVLVGIGISAGLATAFCTAGVLASWLFGVEPRDPVVFCAVPVALALIALVSAWLPARRASRVDPLEALRYE